MIGGRIRSGPGLIASDVIEAFPDALHAVS